MAEKKARVASVTVAFNPVPARIADQVEALRGQVDDIVIVDNGSGSAIAGALRSLESSGTPCVRVLSLDENRGVASGFNEGVEAALQRGCDYVLLLDHDSQPTPGMLPVLLAAHRSAAARGPVAAVGPRIRDSRDGHEFPFIRLGWTHNPRIRCQADAGTVECDFLISSGTLISREALDRIGRFDASLFIDYVDLDWCCKARSMGYSLHGVCGARLDHQLGEEPRTVVGGLRVLVHAPERTYYMTRNRLLLYQRAHVPLKWKLKDAARAVLKLATTFVFAPPRREHWRMASFAVRDGLRRRGGRLPNAGKLAD
ncbi:MAG: glycosyltransferase family 2 protein [Burkholderiales bacterium]|nr:glycosyltransferase family 2 protein [Burkholderiales bacterium]